MPLFNDRRDTNPPVDLHHRRMDMTNPDIKSAMNYTTPKGEWPGADMYGSVYSKSTTNGSQYAKDTAATNKITNRGERADQKRWIERGAESSRGMNIAKHNPANVSKYDVSPGYDKAIRKANQKMAKENGYTWGYEAPYGSGKPRK